MELTNSYTRLMPEDVLDRYDFCEVRDAAAVLHGTNWDQFEDLLSVLQEFWLLPADVITPGGKETDIAKRLNEGFRSRGWREGMYEQTVTSTLSLSAHEPSGETRDTAEPNEVDSRTYKIDNLNNGVALDVEWNAKDGSLDRDLAAYAVLYELGLIRGGIMITRTHKDLRKLGKELQRPKFLQTTTSTHLNNLVPRMARGSAGGCPVLAIAITARCLAPTAAAVGLV